MQKFDKKFLIYFLIGSLSIIYTSFGADLKQQLIKADQYFEQKKYTDAFDIYHSIYLKNNKYTPQTLLKMAMIKEAWGENIDALYYLNTFYQNFPEKRVFNKMKEIAEREKLDGYVYSDLEFFSSLYRNYQNEIILAIVGLMFVYFLAVVTNKIFIKGISNTSPIIFIIFLFIAFYLINFGEGLINPEKAVVMKDKCLLMDGPSPGAKVVSIIEKGNRITIVDQIDIWSKIKFQDKQVYIRTNNLIENNL